MSNKFGGNYTVDPNRKEDFKLSGIAEEFPAILNNFIDLMQSSDADKEIIASVSDEEFLGCLSKDGQKPFSKIELPLTFGCDFCEKEATSYGSHQCYHACDDHVKQGEEVENKMYEAITSYEQRHITPDDHDFMRIMNKRQCNSEIVPHVNSPEFLRLT